MRWYDCLSLFSAPLTLYCIDDGYDTIVFREVGEFQFQDGDKTNSVSDLKRGSIFWCRFDLFKGLLESSEEGGEPRAELL